MHVACRVQVRSDRGRVVGVIVDDPDAVTARQRLEAAAGALERGERLAGGLVGDAKLAGDRQRRDGVRGVVPAGQQRLVLGAAAVRAAHRRTSRRRPGCGWNRSRRQSAWPAQP